MLSSDDHGAAFRQGQNIIIYTAALLGIDNTYFEAAELDGATPLHTEGHPIVSHWSSLPPCSCWLPASSAPFQVFMNAYDDRRRPRTLPPR